MRPPERMDKFYYELKELHKTYFPDWRFGQLCSNFYGLLMTEKHIDLFFPEEEQMMIYLREYI